nr:hypothetical protein [Tanacetum cinerariifolium]
MSSFYESPQCHIYLCQICESNSHYGYECLQRVPLVYEPEPCYVQNSSDNDYSHDLPSVNPLNNHHCCYECGNSLNDFFCPHCTCEFCGNGAHIDSLLDEFAGELTLLKSIPPGIDETNCHPENEIHLSQRLLYDNSSPHPPEEFISENSYAEIESFSRSLIPIEDSDYLMEEINLTFTLDDPMPPGIEEDDDESRDILIREELLDNYSLPPPENESFHFDIPSFSRPPAIPPDGNTGILNIKMIGDVSDQNVPIPEFMITRVSNQEKSPDLLSHRGFEIFQPSSECPMIIHGKNIPILDVPRFHFYPP